MELDWRTNMDAAIESFDEEKALASLAEGLGRGCDMGGKIAGGRSIPLVRALGLRMERLARMLMPVSDLRWIDDYGWSVLSKAAEAGNLEVLTAAATVDDPSVVRHPGGVSALMCAAESGSLKCLAFLAPISPVFARDCYGLSALEFAAKGGEPRMIEACLRLGLRLRNPEGSTCLMLAGERGRARMLSEIIGREDAFEPGAMGETVFSMMADPRMAQDRDDFDQALAAMPIEKRDLAALRAIEEGYGWVVPKTVAGMEARELSFVASKGKPSRRAGL